MSMIKSSLSADSLHWVRSSLAASKLTYIPLNGYWIDS